MIFSQHISFLRQYISIVDIKEYDKKVRSISYSMISKSDNEEELMKYIYKQIEPNINMELGKKIHGNFAGDDTQVNIDYTTHIQGNKVFLCPHTVSESYLIYMSVLNNTAFQLVAKYAKDFEMKHKVGLKFGNRIYALTIIIDLYNRYQNRIIELKTTNSMDVSRVMDKYKYDMQLALYSYVMSHIMNSYNVTIVFVSKAIPYKVCVKNIDDKTLMKGAIKFIRYFNLFEQIIQKHNIVDIFIF